MFPRRLRASVDAVRLTPPAHIVIEPSWTGVNTARLSQKALLHPAPTPQLSAHTHSFRLNQGPSGSPRSLLTLTFDLRLMVRNRS